jgi:hypothetical protein
MNGRPKSKTNGPTPPRPSHSRFSEHSPDRINVGPHRFQSYTFDPAHLQCCDQIRDGCLKAWQLTAEVYVAKIQETGFHPTGLGSSLSEFGSGQLPLTPGPEAISRDPHFTDLSEILALELLTETEEGLVIPVARVYNKEWVGAQHRGIDLLGYATDPAGEYVLFVIEVMASEEKAHPPATVYTHRRQLLDETLNEESLERLRTDLGYVHAEAEEKHKSVLNGFIATLVRDRGQTGGGVAATAVLLRPPGLLTSTDSKPFQDATTAFDTAVVPSRVLFKGVDCGLDFVELFETVRTSIVKGTAGSAQGPR